jgi:uncharacterized protein DUF2840
MSSDLTRVDILSLPDRVHHYTRFGRAVRKVIMPSYRGYEYYRPGQLVGYVQWQAGEYGSRLWRFMILMTVSHVCQINMQEVPGIMPAVRILLDMEGAFKVRKIFCVIDQIEQLGLDPADVSPAYYGHLHQRITANHRCHRYTMEQHKSFLKGQEVLRCR